MSQGKPPSSPSHRLAPEFSDIQSPEQSRGPPAKSHPPPQIKPSLVAAQKWRTRVFFVFDICHTAYDAKLGHLPEQNKLPVAVVHLSKKNTAYVANAWLSKRVNRDIALFHNANGFGAVPPFVEDHTVGKPPEYMNPKGYFTLAGLLRFKMFGLKVLHAFC
ncbi:hypothetical protein HAV15_005125 [Penicillium sp. str. |nr:hypothetical protein HAV15_005125 [Penicillium sp. str. \